MNNVFDIDRLDAYNWDERSWMMNDHECEIITLSYNKEKL